MNSSQSVMQSMIDYYAGDAKRIQHFIKVFQFAKIIGEMEQVDACVQETIEVAAIVHDIGIKVSEEKYDSCVGKYQELEGPPVAESMLKDLGYPCRFIERVCWLVGHHHTYQNIEDIDHQILVEADFLVNAYEDNLPKSAIRSLDSKIFKTKTGKYLLKTLYLKDDCDEIG